MQKLTAAAALAAIALAIIAGAASARRAEYLDAEQGYFECTESGLSRTECLNIFN